MLPADAPVANTAVDWSGVRWTMVISLPESEIERRVVLAHEAGIAFSRSSVSSHRTRTTRISKMSAVAICCDSSCARCEQRWKHAETHVGVLPMRHCNFVQSGCAITRRPLARALRFRSGADALARAERRQDPDGQVAAAEAKRGEAQRALIAKLRERYGTGARRLVLAIDGRMMSFDPKRVTPVAGLGRVFGVFNARGPWGSLQATDGAWSTRFLTGHLGKPSR